MGSRASKENCTGSKFMIPIQTPNQLVEQELNMEVRLVEDETAVYVKITGFRNIEDADDYAQYLADNLPLLLLSTEVMH